MDTQKRIYVGGIPYSATNEELTELFAPYGTVVSATAMTDKMTGQPKGFGFVEMTTAEEANAAVAALANTQMGGRTLTINIARPREERPAGGQGGYNGGGNSRGGGQGGYNGGGNSRGNGGDGVWSA